MKKGTPKPINRSGMMNCSACIIFLLSVFFFVFVAAMEKTPFVFK